MADGRTCSALGERALVSGEMVRETSGPCRLVRVARDFAPSGAVERRKSGIAFEVATDLGQVPQRRDRQRRPVERFDPDHADRVGPSRSRQLPRERTPPPRASRRSRHPHVAATSHLDYGAMAEFQRIRASAQPSWLEWTNYGCSTPFPIGLGDT